MAEEEKKLEVLWTPVQVADFLGVHKYTVYRWLSTNKVFQADKVVRFGNNVRVPRSEVERIAGIKKSKIIAK